MYSNIHKRSNLGQVCGVSVKTRIGICEYILQWLRKRNIGLAKDTIDSNSGSQKDRRKHHDG